MHANLTQTYSEGVFVGYRHYEKNEIPVQFCFGHGLSYTAFSYENVSLETIFEAETSASDKNKEVILIFPSQRKNNKTVRVLKIPKTDTCERKVYIPGFVVQCLIDIKKEQDQVKEALGSEYTDYNLIMATTFGMPINGSYIRDQMQKVIDKEGLPDMVTEVYGHR